MAEPEIDAVFCGSDQIAAGFVRSPASADGGCLTTSRWWATTTGRSCRPRTRPALTTVDMNLEMLGRTAAQHLFAAIDGRATPGVHRMPCELVIRDSHGPVVTAPAFRFSRSFPREACGRGEGRAGAVPRPTRCCVARRRPPASGK
ncbi:substrate-binding domain-containing protein [Nonomuraea dietziae]|uniref:substrate-binding domain-containing protein n=1 Tax=Nonomuraea dietziae TaxID=65515 RepID=UPI0031DA6FF7